MTPRSAVGDASLTLALGACTTDEAPAGESIPAARLVETLRVGAVEGSVAFSPILNISRGPDGATYVLEPIGSRITILSSEGRRVGTVGRAGNRPGEFARPGGMGWRGDTLWVRDGANYRFSLFSPSGDLSSPDGAFVTASEDQGRTVVTKIGLQPPKGPPRPASRRGFGRLWWFRTYHPAWRTSSSVAMPVFGLLAPAPPDSDSGWSSRETEP